MRQPFRANRGGHAPGHIREAFCRGFDIEYNGLESPWYEYLEDGESIFYDIQQVEWWDNLSPKGRGKWLIGQLWNCTDIMPSDLCVELELPLGNTYAQGVRKLSQYMND